jgi:hypothetical protein
MRRPVAALAAALALAATSASPAIAGAGRIEVSPTSLDFGDVCVGASSPSRTVTVRNAAPGEGEDQTLRITAIGVAGAGADYRVEHDPTPIQLPPGESTGIAVRFAPGARGLRQATLQIDHDDQSAPSPFPVTLRGTGRDRRIAVDRPTLAFGEQRVGTRSPVRTVSILNRGEDPLTVLAIARGGLNGGEFAVAAPVTPFALLPGRLAEVRVAFQPAAPGVRTGTLSVSSDACNAPTLAVALVGTGTVLDVAVEPNPIEVAGAPAGAEGPPTAVTIANRGDAPLEIAAVQLTGADAADFGLGGLPEMPTTLAPREEVVATVRLRARGPGPRSAALVVRSDDPDQPALTVPVRGVAGPAASASPTALETEPGPTPSPSPTRTAVAAPPRLGGPSDAVAVGVVVGGVLAAFAGLVAVGRARARGEEEEEEEEV